MPRTALVATLATDPADERFAEAEPVIVDADDDVVRLELDDGKVLGFDRVELLAALQPAA